MELALIGLGRMGAYMAQRLMRAGHHVVGYARHASTVQTRLQEGAIATPSSTMISGVLTHSNPTASTTLMLGSVVASGGSNAATAR